MKDMQNGKVIFSGVGYREAPFGGVARVVAEVGTCLSETYPAYNCLYVGPARARVPQGRVSSLYSFPTRPARVAASINAIRLGLAGWRDSIFQASYYEPPFRGFRGPYVVLLHDFISCELSYSNPNRQDVIRQQIEAIEKADAVISVSQTTANKIPLYCNCNMDKVRVAPLAASPFWTTGNAEKSTDGSYWLFVGNRKMYKNFSTVLRAFAQTASETPHRLKLAGGSRNLEEWEIDFALRSGIIDRIDVLGRCDEDELRSLYQNATGFIFSSLAEGFGLPILEAMACGAPVLASDIEVFREVAGDAALFFDPRDPNALAGAMHKACDPEVRAAFQRRGIARSAQFSWSATAKAWHETYQVLLK